jgi:hypothetical protein
VEFNLRPPGIELWTTHIPRDYEVGLLLLLLGGIFLHRLPEIQAQWGLNLHLDEFWPHLGVSIAVLAIAALLPPFAHGLLRLWSRTLKPRPFLELAYGYLPLVLGGNLAHYLRLGLGEAGQVLPVAALTFGYSGINLPASVADPAVITFLQAATLILATFLTIVLTQKISRQPLRLLLPQHLMAIALAAALWSVIVS